MRDRYHAHPRRRVLRSLLSGAAFSLLSCAGSPPSGPVTVIAGDEGLPDAAPVSLPLDSVPEGGRVQVQWGAIPVEVRKAGTSVEALALVCTHQGCRLERTGDHGYRCLCHEGHFAADGAALTGPPTRPLRRVPLLLSATTVLVGGRPAGRRR